MTTKLNRVILSGTGSFLPNAPIPNDRIDDVLGPLNSAPPKVQQFVRTVGARMLAEGGVRFRHFAVDPETHRLTHTIAGLGEEAARRALAQAGRQPQDVDLLLLACPTYDRSTPPTSTDLQERLGIEQCAEMEIHSNCSGMGKIVQIAYDALRLGRYRTALVVICQPSSVYLRSCYFNQSVMTKTQAALRYILADGSGALFLEAAPDAPNTAPRHEVLGTFVESVGGRRPAGMTAGGSIADLTEAEGIMTAVYERGRHHLDQDFAAVNRDAGPFLLAGAVRMLEALHIPSSQVDHYIWSTPTMQLYEANIPMLLERLGARPEQMKFRATNCGYCGGASIFVHLDEMARAGELQPGQTVVLHSVESSKWMTAGFVVRW